MTTGGDPLADYRSVRDFDRTPEPGGAGPPEPGSGAPPEPVREAAPGPARGQRRFVVQRHRARRVHYDLRLEIGGVLVSWAVPRGPTLDPAARRLAVRVEDHPIEYLDFEGVIPSGEYGGGDVVVWDRGTWEPHGTGDPVAAIASGELHFGLAGGKLAGRFVLVRRGSGSAGGPGQWLLLHARDAAAVSGWDPEDYPESVLSGRTNEEVLASQERLWRPDPPAARTGPGDAELVALSALGAGGTWRVFGRDLRLTNLDKELFPGRDGEPPVTKRELIGYAARIAPVILPYLAGRPLHMHRFPGGAAKPGFWHKQLPDHAPAWVPRWRDPEAEPGKTTTYLVIDEPAALVWAANFGALEWHAWTALARDRRHPSYALIDIDPGPATRWEDVLLLARLHRTALDHLAVQGQPKVTGRRGIQIWIPVSGVGYDETRDWVERLSKSIGAVVPELVSWAWDVAGRRGLARLDYTQNVLGKTLVAPYSPRAAPGAPVSAPIGWDELDDPSLRPDAFTIRMIADRVARRGDLFRGVLGPGRQLPLLS